MPTREPAAPSTTAQRAEEHVRRAQLQVAEIFGNIAAFWGLTRTQGRIYGLLFVAPEPLDQTEIRARLDISAGSASMTLQSLLDWGVIERRDRLYVAQTDLWKAITEVMRRREKAQVEAAIASMTALVESLRGAADASPRVRFVLARAQRLLEFFELGRGFLDAFVAARPVHGLLTHIIRRATRLSASRATSDARLGT
jgi:DNA-binding transcriptional regulator GbsR (MarR family)